MFVQTIIAMQMKVWAPIQILAVFMELGSGDLFCHNIGEIPLVFQPVLSISFDREVCFLSAPSPRADFFENPSRKN